MVLENELITDLTTIQPVRERKILQNTIRFE